MFPVLDNSGWISKNGEMKIYELRATSMLAGLT